MGVSQFKTGLAVALLMHQLNRYVLVVCVASSQKERLRYETHFYEHFMFLAPITCVLTTLWAGTVGRESI